MNWLAYIDLTMEINLNLLNMRRKASAQRLVWAISHN